jgi:hypothetical protein
MFAADAISSHAERRAIGRKLGDMVNLFLNILDTSQFLSSIISTTERRANSMGYIPPQVIFSRKGRVAST